MALHLVKPSMALVDAYRKALVHGFSPNNLSVEKTRLHELRALQANSERFIASIDGSRNEQAIQLYERWGEGRIPGFRRWLMKDGEFVGSFGFRWIPGTETLPEEVPGHLGYAIAEWERRKGYATAGVFALLEEILPLGLRYVDVSIAADNLGSIGVTEACGGIYHHSVNPSRFYPEGEERIYRIALRGTEA